MVAHIRTKQNDEWINAGPQRDVQRLWELWCEGAQTYQTKCNLVVARSKKHSGEEQQLKLLIIVQDSQAAHLHRHVHQTHGLSVVPWNAVHLWNKVRLSGVGLLQDARWEIVSIVALDQVCRLAADLRAEADKHARMTGRMTTWKNCLRTAACN